MITRNKNETCHKFVLFNGYFSNEAG